MPIHVPVADFERSAPSPAEWPEDGPPEVAFVGRSNVGKSSLVNFLVGRRGLVRTSRTPGRTRLANFFKVEVLVGGERRAMRFVDLPGFGYAHVSKAERAGWRPLIEAYLGKRASLAVVVLLFDARRGAEEEEKELLGWIARRGVKVVPAITKADKLAKHERPLAAQRLKKELGIAPVVTSVDGGEGRDALWRRILG